MFMNQRSDHVACDGLALKLKKCQTESLILFFPHVFGASFTAGTVAQQLLTLQMHLSQIDLGNSLGSEKLIAFSLCNVKHED